MPLYEYENLKTGQKFQKVLPMARRKEPCTAPYIKLAIVAPSVLTISDSKGNEDKLREDLHTKAQVAKKEKQVLEADTNEAQGDPKKAGDIVGYAPGYYLKAVKSLKEQILERSEYSLAMHSAKAVKGLVDALDEDGKTPGVNIRMEAAKQILDRVGIVKRDKLDVTAQVAHGIFILPPKDGITKTES